VRPSTAAAPEPTVRPTSRPALLTARRATLLTQLVAAAALLALGADLTLKASVTTGTLAALALLPVWCAALREHPGARAVVGLTVAALASGVLLAAWPDNAHDVELRYAYATALRTATVVAGLGVVLWCRRVLQLGTVVLLHGAGALAVGVLHSPGSPNPWKYLLALPVSLVALGALQRLHLRRGATPAAVLTLLLLAAVSVVNDYRSFFGFTALTAGVVLWQARRPARRSPSRRRLPRWPTVVLVVVAGGYAFSRAVTSLLLSGDLGAEL